MDSNRNHIHVVMTVITFPFSTMKSEFKDVQGNCCAIGVAGDVLDKIPGGDKAGGRGLFLQVVTSAYVARMFQSRITIHQIPWYVPHFSEELFFDPNSCVVNQMFSCQRTEPRLTKLQFFIVLSGTHDQGYLRTLCQTCPMSYIIAVRHPQCWQTLFLQQTSLRRS